MTLDMRTAPLGHTGLDITRVGFGSWAMSGPNSPSYWGPQDDEVSIATIRHAIDSGIGWIDTAAVYGMGHAERIVGAAVAPYRQEDRPLIFTKAGMRWDKEAPDASIRKSGRPESIRAEVDASLERLGVERIDLYQMHWPADDTDVAEYWAVFDELVKAGKVRAIGVSNHSIQQLEAAHAVAPVGAIQVPLNLLNAASLDSVIPWAQRNGVGVLLYSPMASGLLTGKYRTGSLDSLAEGDWRRRSPLFTPENLVRVGRLTDVMREVAAEHETTVSAVAVAWALTQPGVSAAIVGARTPEQIADWIDAGRIELPGDAVRRLDEARREHPAGAPW